MLIMNNVFFVCMRVMILCVGRPVQLDDVRTVLQDNDFVNSALQRPEPSSAADKADAAVYRSRLR